MNSKERYVFDTNTIISAFLFNQSKPRDSKSGRRERLRCLLSTLFSFVTRGVGHHKWQMANKRWPTSAKLSAMVHYYPRHHILRAKSHELNGDIERAIQTYEHFRNLIDTQLYYMGGDAFDYFLERSKIDYELGRLCEQKEDWSKAEQCYSNFLQQWQNADEALPELIDARKRTTRLMAMNGK